MILKKVKIYNYRQLQKVELDLQNSLTVLAGPNNSGKTTLISVLKGMFRDKKLSFTYSDIKSSFNNASKSLLSRYVFKTWLLYSARSFLFASFLL